MNKRHTCPCAGCGREIPSGLLMCGPHWRMVPKPHQDAVWAAWRAAQGIADAPQADDRWLKYRAAVDLAVSLVNEKIAEKHE